VTYFRAWDRDEDPSKLLDPSQQYSTPWGEPDHGPCDSAVAPGKPGSFAVHPLRRDLLERSAATGETSP
jgi:hypothetical protein